jgi:hypothetical protein
MTLSIHEPACMDAPRSRKPTIGADLRAAFVGTGRLGDAPLADTE